MIRRTAAVKEEILKALECRMERSAHAIEQYHMCHRAELRERILSQFREIFELCSQKEVAYIQICYLHTALLLDTYQYKVILADELYYLDTGSVSGNISFDFIYSSFLEDVDYCIKIAEIKYHWLYANEVMAIKEACNYYYIGFVENYLESIIKPLMEMKSFEKLKKQKDFKIIFGEYMGRGKIIHGPFCNIAGSDTANPEDC